MVFNDIQNTAKNIASNPFANKPPLDPKVKIPAIHVQDEISQLLECSFRGISFPVESLDLDFTQDVIQHKRMDRNGAKLENTGLGALTFNIKAPFYNTIARGPNETWSDLYPTQKNKMLDALQDRTTGDFIHPELGLRRCKAANLKTSLNANDRSGIVLNFSLIEDSEDLDAVEITANSNVAIAKRAAVNLDASLAKLKVDPGLSADGFKNFTDVVDKIQGKFDQIGLLQKQVIGKIDRVIAKINKLSDTVYDSTRQLGNSPDLLISSLLDIKKSVLVLSKPIGYFQTKAKTTVIQICNQFQSNVQDIITLNPQLASSPTIPAFTLIRYYK